MEYRSFRKRFRESWDMFVHVDSDCDLVDLSTSTVYVSRRLLGSAEAEYMTLTQIIKILIWIIHIIEDIPGQFVRRPVTIYGDNIQNYLGRYDQTIFCSQDRSSDCS